MPSKASSKLLLYLGRTLYDNLEHMKNAIISQSKRQKAMAKGFYLHHSIVDYGVYTSIHTYFSSANHNKSFWLLKIRINKPVLHAKFQTDWFETVENRSDSKSISDSVYMM